MKRTLKYVLLGYLSVVALHFGVQLAAISSPTMFRVLSQLSPAKAIYLIQGRTFGNATFGSGFLTEPQKYLSQEAPESVDEIDIVVVIMSENDPEGTYDDFGRFFSGAEATAFFANGDKYMRTMSTSLFARFHILPLGVRRKDAIFINDTAWSAQLKEQECLQEALYNLMFSIEDDAFDDRCILNSD